MTMFAAGSRIFSARNIKPFLPLLVYAALALLVAAVYLSSFRQIETLIQDDKLRDLGAVADIKAAQIAEWRDNYRREGEAHTRNSLLAVEFGLWLREGAPSNERKQRLRRMLAELQHAEGYVNLVLLDRRGVVRLSLVDGFALAAEDAQPVKQAVDSGEVVFKDFHHDSQGEHGIRFDLMAPLTVAGEKVVGVMELEIDPYISLYPMIRSWPARSESAESLLVRREGNDVLFLNDLRHKKATALNLRVSADDPDLPAAMAVRGLSSAAAGVDYRGVPVVAEMRQVAGTPWFVVSKVDRDEMFAPVEQLKQWSASLGATLIVVGGLLVLTWLRRYQTRFSNLQEQHAAAVEREMLMRHFEYLTKYANDIILVTDEAGNLVEANERAQQAYGYRREELLHMPVLGLCESKDVLTFKEQVEKFNELGESRFETLNRRKDGSLFPVEVSVRAIMMEDAFYFQFIIRDIGERRQAEDALRRSEALLRKSQQMAHIGSWELDLKNNVLYWSDENYRIFEVDPSRFGASYEAFLNAVHPDDRDRVSQAYADSVSNKKPYNIIHRLQFPDMRVKFVQEWCETHYDESGQPLRSVGTTQDVTVQQMFQQALRKSAQRIEDLYNSAPCGYHSLDKGGVIVQINDTELQWLGYTRDEVVGKINFADLLAPGCRQLFYDNYPGFKQRGFVRDLEYELVRKDGPSLFVLLNATAVYDDDGEYLMSRSTLFDITARKQAEDELRFHSTILSQMEEGVVLVRADTGTVVYVNPKFEQIFGYAAGEMEGLHASQLNAPTAKSPEEVAREIMTALREQGCWEGEINNIKKDGSAFWCHAAISTFEHHDYGKIWLSTHEDITARKLAETKLEESEARFRTMADGAPIMIWMSDLQDQTCCHGCNYFNQGWYAFTGLSPQRVQSCEWQTLIHQADKARCLDAYRDAFLNLQPFSLEYRLRRHDGEYRWMLDSGVPRFGAEGIFLGFIGTCLDVTDHKLFDEMRAEMEHAGRLQIAGEMTSGLAHELSQPLSAANNYLSAGLLHMAESDWDKNRLLKVVSLAHAQTERAGAIINHLKDMVRKQRQDRVMLDVNTLIRDTVHFMEYEIRQHAVSVVMDFYTLPSALASKVEIEQVLVNLIKNAVDSMASTPRRVLRVTTRMIDSGFILVSVSDTGKGIVPDDLDKVFNPFQSSKQEGLGLGLPICRSLVENHGGKIWAEQYGDEGACFNFTLPVGVSDE
ncbi:MAG: PAS domain S-box protein [Gallionella sp.]